MSDSAQVLSRLASKGVITESVGSADAQKLVKTNTDGLLSNSLLVITPTITAHIADETKHLTSGQNSLLDALTASATELNYVDGVTSAIQPQLDTASGNLTTHIADETKHLTSGQNSLLDAITASSTEINYLVGVTSAVQTQLNTAVSDLATHTADATIHITSGQNSLLDALTATAVELNYVDGVTSAIQTQLDTNASDLSTHVSDATIHITSGQNSLLDALTATAAELNHSVGVTSAIQTQIDTLLPKAGGTMTGQLIVTPGANVVGETINGVVTGGAITRSLLTINDDWTGATGGTSAPILLKLAITDTGGSLNYGATKVMSVVRNGSEVFYMNHGGEMTWAAGVYISTNSTKIQVPSSWNFNWNGDLWLFRNTAASLQLGVTHATTPTAQTIGAHPVTTGTGADLTLQGGSGSVARGNVILLGGNRAAYDAAPSTTTIRDILISHGLMAAS